VTVLARLAGRLGQIRVEEQLLAEPLLVRLADPEVVPESVVAVR
jgi:hypothetical protein